MSMRRLIAGAAVAVSVALPMSTSAATAVWAGDVAGSVDDETKWVNGYKPQAGDTLDFSVLSGSFKQIIEDFNDERRFETVIAPAYLYMGEKLEDGHVGWRLKYLTYSSGADFRVGSSGRLHVDGSITLTGSSTYFFYMFGSTTVVAGEIVNQGQSNYLVRHPNANASFRANGYWSSLLAAIRSGDFVGIQFGHNDQKAGSNFAAPDGLFRDNVRQFVADVRALGGKPILLSPIVRGTFDGDGNLYEDQLDNGPRLSQYATAMRELSVELGTDFVDMNALTHDLLVELGKAESAKLFAASAGKSGDYTHPIPAGADAFARLFVKNVKDRGLEVAALFS